MSILDPRTLEDELYDADTRTVEELLAALHEGRAPNRRFWMCFLRLSTALRDGVDPTDRTGSKECFRMWFTNEADNIVVPLSEFMQHYIATCRDERNTLPLVFDSGQEESHFTTALNDILKAMKRHRQGFAFWPPQPQH